jgi:di/tricarboxylate transporter
VTLPVISLAALVAAILLSCTTRLNVGLLALAFAWIIGVYVGGMTLDQVLSGFPVPLFLTLAGVTLLFTQAHVNGTLERLAGQAVRLCRGNVGLIPVMFFFMSMALSTLGAGSISTAAFMAPVAMAVSGRAKIPAFLMALMVANGANAGAVSPFAPTGIIAAGLFAKMGLAGREWNNFYYVMLAHLAAAFAGYLLFGGLALFRRRYHDDASTRPAPFEPRHWLTLAAIGALIAGVLLANLHIGMGAFAAAVLLILFRAAPETEAIAKMPWGVILMVSGVTVLVALVEKTQGMDLFTAALARLAAPHTVNAVVAFVTGLVSVYSSTSGVVLPAFLPTIPGLVERLGGGDAAHIAYSMNIGANLVDVSPLSTVGALCIAAAPVGEQSGRLFYQLLAWGLSMTAVAALFCYAFLR